MAAKTKSPKKDANAQSSQRLTYVGPALLAIGCVIYGWFFFLQGDRAALLARLARPEDRLTDLWATNLANFGLLDRTPLLVVAAMILLAAYFVGNRTVRAIIPEGLQPGERAVFALGTGLSFISLATFLLGLSGGLHWFWGTRLVVAALAIGGGYDVVLSLREARESFRELLLPAHRFSLMLAVGTGLFTAMLLWASLMPLSYQFWWTFDSLEYHLQAPKEWLQAGRITFLPHNIYANMPLGDEMLVLLAMQLMPGEENWWYGGLAGKLVMAAVVPLTALALAAAGRCYESSFAGWSAALIYGGLPWLTHTATQAMVEPALACYGWLAFQSALLVGKIKRIEWLAGFFAGSAIACKYPSLVMIALPIVLVVTFHRKPTAAAKRQSMVRIPLVQVRGFDPYVAAFVVAAAIAVGPWLIKNQLTTDNPVYPLAVSTFGGETRSPEKDERFRAGHAVPKDDQGRQYTLRSVAAAIQDVLLKNAYQSPLLVPFLVTALICPLQMRTKPDPESLRTTLAALFFAAWIFLSWWLFTHRVDRFWIPALPPLVFLAGIGVGRFTSPLDQRVVAAVLVAGLTFHFAFLISPFAGDVCWFTRLDLLRSGKPLSEFDQPRLPPHFIYLNEHVPANEAVLCVGDAAVYELRPKCFYNTCWDDCVLVDWMENRSADERLQAFAEHKVTWVCVNDFELHRYRQPGNYGYDPRYEDSLIDELVEQKVLQPVATKIFQDYGIRLFKVRQP